MSICLCGAASAQQSTVHFVTEFGGQTSHYYALNNFGIGGADKSGTGTIDGSTTVTWSTDDDGNLTIKVNGVSVADLPDAGYGESGWGWEGGGEAEVEWTNLDFAQPI